MIDVPAGRLHLGEALDPTAENRVDERQQALADLEADLAADLTAIGDEWTAEATEVETVDVPLERSDVKVTSLVLTWVPS